MSTLRFPWRLQHDPSMSIDSFVSLLLGIPIGLISGLYTGLIISRYARFAELRNEVLRAIRRINFMQEETFIRIMHGSDIQGSLTLVAADLLFLVHRKAGAQVQSLAIEIAQVNQLAMTGQLIVEQYGSHYADWQERARELPPNMWVIWSLWGKL